LTEEYSRSNPMERAARIVTILNLVPEEPTGRRVGRQELADACECDVRTIQRTLVQMELYGLPIEYNAQHHTYLMVRKGMKLSALTLTITDILALAAARAILCSQSSPFRNEIDVALNKVTAGLSEDLAGLMESASIAFGEYGHTARDYSGVPMVALTKAITRRETIEMTYGSRTSNNTRRRKVDPYKIKGWEGGYLGLAAWCHERKEVRTFALDRIVDPKPTGEQFTIQPWDDNDEGVVHGLSGGPEIEVIAKFSSTVARSASEHRWRFKAEFVDGEDGSVTLHGSVRGTDGIIRELISWRSHVEVIGGAELRRAMREEVLNVARMYADTKEKSEDKESE